MMKANGTFSQWLRRSEGAALIEFALLLPFMALLLFGGAEATNYILVNQRVEKAGYVLADITTQFQQQSAAVARPGELTEGIMDSDIFPQLERVMGDGADPSNQVVILTSLSKEAGVIKVKWQKAGGGTLTTDVTSQVNGLSPSGISGAGAGLKDSPANLPPEVASTLDTMVDGQNIVVCELFVRYKPIASTIIGEKTLKKRIFLQPRNDDGKLVCLPPTFVYPECTGGPPPPPKPPCGSGYCDGPDWVTRDCDGKEVSRGVCVRTCRGIPVSACDGNDYVTKYVTPNCPDDETARDPNNTANGCMPVCSPAAPNDCSSGVVGNINPGSCGGNATWTCTGAGGGVANCSMPNAACPPPPPEAGVCGATYLSCTTGTPANGVDNTACNTNKTWNCVGTNNGATTNCSIANQACQLPPGCFPTFEVIFAYNSDCTGGIEQTSISCPAGLGAPQSQYGASGAPAECGVNLPTESKWLTECKPCGTNPPPPPVNGACGSVSGTQVATLTAGSANLCATGSVISFAGTGPWTWGCAGVNGGNPTSATACNASIQAPPPCIEFDGVDFYPTLSVESTNNVENAIIAANPGYSSDPAYAINRALKCIYSFTHNTTLNPSGVACPAGTPYLSQVLSVVNSSPFGSLAGTGQIGQVRFGWQLFSGTFPGDFGGGYVGTPAPIPQFVFSYGVWVARNAASCQ